MRTVIRIIGIIAIIALSATPSSAQTVQVSFSQQTDAVVKKITGGVPSMKNVMIYEVIACNNSTDTRSLHSGYLYQAAQKSKIAVVGPQAANFLFTRVQRLHWMTMALNAAQWGSFAAGILAGADTIAIPSALKGALPLLSQGFKQASDKIQGDIPDFAPLAKSILDDQLALPPGTCKMGMIFATSGPAEPVFQDVQSVVVPQPVPAPLPAAQPTTPAEPAKPQ